MTNSATEFLSYWRVRCDVMDWLKCLKWAQADRVRGLMQWLGAMQQVLLSWPCRLTASQLRPPRVFCFLSWCWCHVCHTKNPLSSRPPWRHHMAGGQQYGETAFSVNFKEQTPPTPPMLKAEKDKRPNSINLGLSPFEVRNLSGTIWGLTPRHIHTQKRFFHCVARGFCV